MEINAWGQEITLSNVGDCGLTLRNITLDNTVYPHLPLLFQLTAMTFMVLLMVWILTEKKINLAVATFWIVILSGLLLIAVKPALSEISWDEESHRANVMLLALG